MTHNPAISAVSGGAWKPLPTYDKFSVTRHAHETNLGFLCHIRTGRQFLSKRIRFGQFVTKYLAVTGSGLF